MAIQNALNLTVTGMISATGAGVYNGRTITGTSNQISISNGNGVSGNPTISTPQDIASTSSPTFSSLTLTNPLTAANGGTGASSLTDGGVLVGSGVGAITALAAGTNGQLLIGSTGLDPVFSTVTSSNGSITLATGAGTIGFTVTQAGEAQIGGAEIATQAEVTTGTDDARYITPLKHVTSLASPPAIGGTVPSAGTFTAINCDNININGNTISITNANGDMIQKANGTGDWRVTTPADANALFVDENGNVTMALQPAFIAYSSSSQTNVTGTSGTGYITVVFGAELLDQGGDYSTSTFTVPSGGSGLYKLDASVFFGGVTAATTQLLLRFVASNETIIFQNGNVKDASGNIIMGISASTYMDAADTVIVEARAIGEASDVVDLNTSGTSTRFSGYKAV